MIVPLAIREARRVMLGFTVEEEMALLP